MKKFEENLEYFINHINSIRKTFPLVMSLGSVMIEKIKNDNEELINSKYVTKNKDVDGNITYSVHEIKRKEFQNFHDELRNVVTAFKIMPKSMMVSLISVYDTFIGNLIEVMFYVKPELLNTLDKNISFTEILNFSSIGDLKEEVISKETNSVLRKSHIEQIEYFETKLKITLKSNKELIGEFAEITERRNLFAHNDGKVTNHYINSCKENGYIFNIEPEIGSILKVDKNYFDRAVNCLLEIGIILTHIIWRKLLPKDFDDYDDNFIDITFKLIERSNYQLAINLLEFVLSLKLNDEEDRTIYLINLCQCYKWIGNEKKCRDLIEKQNFWGLCKEKYKIAKHVLLDEYEQVYKLLEKYHKDDNVIRKDNIRYWPLFKKLREEKIFIELFEKLYGEPIDNKCAEHSEIIEQTLIEQEDAATDCI